MKRRMMLVCLVLLLCATWPSLVKGQGPIPISRPEDLLLMKQQPGASFVLTQHIDMKGVDYTPFAFAGSLNGAGFAIYNLHIDAPGPERETTKDGNRVPYDTVFAGLFSTLKGARVENLRLVGLEIRVDTPENCFVGGLAGFMQGTTVERVSVQGRLWLSTSGKMGGVGGILGFGDGLIKHSDTRVELGFIDTDRRYPIEQFLGGIVACGYADVDACDTFLRGFASVHGFVHTGGLYGMYHVHDDAVRKQHPGFVTNSTVDGHIRFFENSKRRRAYCRRFVGEPLHRTLVVENNVFTHFLRDEVTSFRKILVPENDENPVYEQAVIPPTDTDFGYTLHTCAACGYQFQTDFVAPILGE